MDGTKPLLIGVDTNVLLDQAEGTELVLDALSTIRRRLPAAKLIVPPTVLEEPGYFASEGEAALAASAEAALLSLFEWGYQPLNLVPVGRGIVEQIALKLRTKGIIAEEELNDSYIVAEAALIGCTILLSSDHHLLEANTHPLFHALLRDCDVAGEALVIATPRQVVQKFFRR